MDNGNQYFKKKIIFMSKNVHNAMLDFNGLIAINDVIMTSWVGVITVGVQNRNNDTHLSFLLSPKQKN